MSTTSFGIPLVVVHRHLHHVHPAERSTLTNNRQHGNVLASLVTLLGLDVSYCLGRICGTRYFPLPFRMITGTCAEPVEESWQDSVIKDAHYLVEGKGGDSILGLLYCLPAIL